MSLVAIMGFGALVFAAPTVGAVDAIKDACAIDASTSICQSGSNSDFGTMASLIINGLLFLIGAVSVVMIIIGGMMYATSSGDSGQVTKAKNTILYSVIGLAVAFFAYAIVNWVLGQL